MCAEDTLGKQIAASLPSLPCLRDVGFSDFRSSKSPEGLVRLAEAALLLADGGGQSLRVGTNRLVLHFGAVAAVKEERRTPRRGRRHGRGAGGAHQEQSAAETTSSNSRSAWEEEGLPPALRSRVHVTPAPLTLADLGFDQQDCC